MRNQTEYGMLIPQFTLHLKENQVFCMQETEHIFKSSKVVSFSSLITSVLLILRSFFIGIAKRRGGEKGVRERQNQWHVTVMSLPCRIYIFDFYRTNYWYMENGERFVVAKSVTFFEKYKAFYMKSTFIIILCYLELIIMYSIAIRLELSYLLIIRIFIRNWWFVKFIKPL